MKVKRLLIVIALLLFAASAALLTLRYTGSLSYKVLSVEDIEAMPAEKDDYRSINNWGTVEVTAFDGVPLVKVLERCGIDGEGAQVRVIAPDGYFWPEVGTWMTMADLRRENPDGLYRIVAYNIDGNALDPEPDGTGPLRYVAPQYSPDEVNKPSWVSNLRLIEVGPLEEGAKAPDAKDVPSDEIWVYGNVPASYPVSLVFPIVAAAIGLVVLIMALTVFRAGTGRRRPNGEGVSAVSLLVAFALVAASLAACGSAAVPCLAQQSPVVLSMSELQSMPAFSGHYTFLKQLPPYTYYEQDYTGVPLSSILREKVGLSPGAGTVVVKAKDGYTATLTMQQVDAVYQGGLKVIIAYSKGGQPLAGDEGPLRLVVPQSSQGTRDQGGDANTPLCGRMIYAVEVQPLPAGASAPDPGTVPSGSLAVYGAVSAPAVPSPAPVPAPSAPQPAAPAVAEPAAAAPGPPAAAGSILARVNSMFGGPDGLAVGLAGRGLSLVYPWPVGFVVRSASGLRRLL